METISKFVVCTALIYLSQPDTVAASPPGVVTIPGTNFTTGSDSRYRIMNPREQGFGILTLAPVYTENGENYAQLDSNATREEEYLKTDGKYFKNGLVSFFLSEIPARYTISLWSNSKELLVASPEEISPEPGVPQSHYLFFSKNDSFAAGGDKRNHSLWYIGKGPSSGVYSLYNQGAEDFAQIVRHNDSQNYTWLRVPNQPEFHYYNNLFNITSVPLQSTEEKQTPKTIRNLYSGRCLTVNNSATEPQASAAIWDCNKGNESSQWNLNEVARNKYKVVNNKSGLCLTISKEFDPTRDKFTYVEQNTCDETNDLAKIWEVEQVEGSLFGEVLMKLMDAMCLDLSDWGKEDGNGLIIWGCHGLDNQRFVIDPPLEIWN